MRRQLTDHVVPVQSIDNLIEIEVMDEPGAGGACHVYEIAVCDANSPHTELTQIKFQKGPVREDGPNGITQEALLAIVIDRLRSFQAGPFSCRENAIALTHIETGLHWLQQRTLERSRRGVEGLTQA